MECSSTLHYLLDIIQTEELTSMAKLAAMSILNKLFIDDGDMKIMQKCLKADITTSLLYALDLGLSSNCDPADTVYVSVAMEVMLRLAKLKICEIQPLITEGVVQRLLAYLDVTGQFYRFDQRTRVVLGKLCQNKQLVSKVKVVAMGMEPLEYIHLHTKNKLKSHVRLPDRVKLCEMYDTGGTEDVAISDFMIQSQLAWPGSFPGEVIKDNNEWQDIFVTQVLDGGMFWAHVGEKCIKDVSMIQQVLNCDAAFTRSSMIKIGDITAVQADIDGTNCLIRAQIMGASGSVVDVFAVDFGYALKVEPADIFSLPDSLEISLVPRKISLCSVAGIQPKPFDEDLVQMAASILTSLTKHSYESGKILCKLDGIAILEKLLQRRLSPILTTQLVSLLNNLATNRRQHKHLTDSTIIPCVLGTLGRYVAEIQAQELMLHSVHSDMRMVIIRSIMVLTNLMYGNSQARHRFYNNEGINIMVQLLKSVGQKNDAIYRMLTHLFRQFIGTAVIKVDEQEVATAKSDRLVPTNQQVTDSLSQLKHETSSKYREPDQLVDKHQGNKLTVNYDSDSETELQCYSENICKPRTLHSGTHVRECDRYVRGQSVHLIDDDQHVICPKRMVNKIASSTLCEHVCGMLNTGQGGKIYFGVDKDSCVFGLELTRDEKDMFRLGIDQALFGRIDPALLHTQYEFKAKHVLDPDTGKPIPDLYVMEICVKPSQCGSVYTTSSGNCYYRFGSETSSISRLELRQLIVIEEEAQYIDQIKMLLRQKASLMSQLQMINSS